MAIAQKAPDAMSRLSVTGFLMRYFAHVVAAVVILTCGASSALGADGDDAAADRIFGVLPNYTTVDAPARGTVSGPRAPMQTTREAFTIASLGTFDPVVYPFIGIMTAMGAGSSDTTYGQRYAVAFADNAIGNFMTTAIVPSLTHEDSRYYRRGEGGVLGRLAYAASRSVVTRTRSGAATFNISEVAGTAAAAGLSNIYYSPADRTAGGTLTRWGTQVMWDTVANELKEFWPDIRARLHRR